MHERMGRRAIRELARGVLREERERLRGLERALRAVREGLVFPGIGGREGEFGMEGVGVGVGVGVGMDGGEGAGW